MPPKDTSSLIYYGQYGLLKDIPLECYHVTFEIDNLPSIEIQTRLLGKKRTAATKSLVDSGATASFINIGYARKLNMKLEDLDKAIKFAGATKNESSIHHYTVVKMETQDTDGI